MGRYLPLIRAEMEGAGIGNGGMSERELVVIVFGRVCAIRFSNKFGGQKLRFVY